MNKESFGRVINWHGKLNIMQNCIPVQLSWIRPSGLYRIRINFMNCEPVRQHRRHYSLTTAEQKDLHTDLFQEHSSSLHCSKSSRQYYAEICVRPLAISL
jgi:hypothetical protein